MLVFDINVSHGSVATRLRCGGMFHNDFIANLQLSLSVKEFWKSVNIWQSYRQKYSGMFFWLSVYRLCYSFSYFEVINDDATRNVNIAAYESLLVSMPYERMVTSVPTSWFPSTMDWVMSANESAGSPLASNRITAITDSLSHVSIGWRYWACYMQQNVGSLDSRQFEG